MKFLRKLAARQQEKHAISIVTHGKVMFARIHPCRNSTMRFVSGTDVMEIKWSLRKAITKILLNGINILAKNAFIQSESILHATLTRADQHIAQNRQTVAKDIPFDDSLPLRPTSSDMAKWASSKITRTGTILDRRDASGFGSIVYNAPYTNIEIKTLEHGACAAVTINNLAVFTMPADVDHVASALRMKIIRNNLVSDINAPTHIKIAA